MSDAPDVPEHDAPEAEPPPARIAMSDVDEVIAAAARAKDAQVDSLSVEELQEVARELDIPAELVEPAIAQVRRRRAEVLAAEQAEAAASQRRRRIVAGVGASAGLVLLAWGLVARAAVHDAWLEVERCRAQVVNVRDRQLATQAQWAAAPDGPDKRAELSGAENRVRIEQQRYDQAATAYRRERGSLGGRLVGALGDHPPDVPLSSEIEW